MESGVAELETVLDQKLVRFNENVVLGEDADAVIGSSINELKRYLQDPTKFVLLDATMASLAQSMINEGLVLVPERAVSNASEAVLGTGLLARLPAFTTAPLDEVVDLRQDLDELLDRYRRKVSHLRSELRTGPFDEHIETELDAVWRAEVDPAIAEIRQAMADHGLIRDPPIPGREPVRLRQGRLAACRAEGLLRQHPGPQHRRGALHSCQKGRAAARAHDLYYLYEVNRRLSE